MKKKICILFINVIMVTASLFAVMLPEGTNAKTRDVKLDGTKILSAELSEPTQINTPLGKVLVSGNVEFYPSGKVKGISLDQDVMIGKTKIYESIKEAWGAYGTALKKGEEFIFMNLAVLHLLLLD